MARRRVAREMGRRMKIARIQAGYTQEQAAEALGVTREAVGTWEIDTRSPGPETMMRLAELYQVKVGYFYGDYDTPLDRAREDFAVASGRLALAGV